MTLRTGTNAYLVADWSASPTQWTIALMVRNYSADGIYMGRWRTATVDAGVAVYADPNGSTLYGYTFSTPGGTSDAMSSEQLNFNSSASVSKMMLVRNGNSLTYFGPGFTTGRTFNFVGAGANATDLAALDKLVFGAWPKISGVISKLDQAMCEGAAWTGMATAVEYAQYVANTKAELIGDSTFQATMLDVWDFSPAGAIGAAVANGTTFAGLKNGTVMTLVGTTATVSSVANPVTRVTAPVITGPSGASVTAPSTANFSASVSGTYTGLRWQRQAAGAGAWADVVGGTGGTTTSYTTGATAVSGGSFNNTDKFRLAVDWSGGTVTSTEVLLTVIAGGTAPAFSVQPGNQTATVGGTATFNFTVTGSGSLTVQAKKNGVDVGSPFAVTASVSAGYTTPSLLIGDNGASYTFVATGDTLPTATSSAAVLTVQQPIATTFTFTLNGGNSLTGLKYAVFDQVTPDLWEAPVKKGANEATDGSGVCTIDVTGLTTRRIDQLGSVFITNSDGTATGGSQAATRRGSYYVGVFS